MKIIALSKTIVGAGVLSCFLVGYSPYSINNNVVKYDGKKFTILSSGLINVQPDGSEPSHFEDSAEDIQFDVKQNGSDLIIKTNQTVLTYSKNDSPLMDRIGLKCSKNNKISESPINQKDNQNLGGLIKSADRADGELQYQEYDLESEANPIQIPNGLLSKRGWTVLKKIDNKLVHGDVGTASSEIFIFCYGNDYKQALTDFVNLNGRIPMLPKWSFGTWFSRYQPLSADDYKQIVKRFRQEKIPIDVVVADMNWHIDGWFGLRYDLKNFPDMKGFFDWASNNGIHVGFNHHPGAVYRDDPRAEDFVKKIGWDLETALQKTDQFFEDSSWDAVKNTFYYGEENPDYIKPFFDDFIAPIMDQGLDFNWVDGSPSLEVLREYYRLSEKELNTRTIILTRQIAGSFDHHRYPLAFGADTYISWESLKFNIEQSLAGSNVGVYWSHDIGGHMERYPDMDHSEMFARWLQLGAMSPITRLHATGGVEWDPRQVHVRKPWEWGVEVLESSRQILQLKYRLLPYIYTLNRVAYDEGLLMTYGMYIDYPEDPNAYKYAASQYMFGASILVAPITDPAAKGKGVEGDGEKKVWIPEGTWYDYFSGERVEGPVEILTSKPIKEMPIYIKEGAIIPMIGYMEYTDQKPWDNLIVEFYQPTNSMESSFKLYEDDGKSLAYKDNQYRWTTIDYSYDAENGTTIAIQPAEGSYRGNTTTRTYRLIVKQIEKAPQSVTLNEKVLADSDWYFENNQLTINTKELSVSEPVILKLLND